MDDPSGRLAAYLARSQTALDLLALLTLWIVVVPPGDFGNAHHASTIALIVRIALSVIYGIDMTIRTRLASRHWHYVRTHLLGLAAVAFRRCGSSSVSDWSDPCFGEATSSVSARRLRPGTQRGDHRASLRASRHGKQHPHPWSIRVVVRVTVTTVGYGDYFPVTPGQVAAGCIMAIGLLTLAVVTAQVSSNFVDQAAREEKRRAGRPNRPG